MKYQKLLLGVAAVCLLVGASGVAEAANCSSGFIINKTVTNVTIQQTSCVIIGSTVVGNILPRVVTKILNHIRDKTPKGRDPPPESSQIHNSPT